MRQNILESSYLKEKSEAREELLGSIDSKLVSFASEWLHAISIRQKKEQTSEEHSWTAKKSLNEATWILGIFQITLLILFATVTGTEVLDSSVAPGTGTQGYNMFIGVEVMM